MTKIQITTVDQGREIIYTHIKTSIISKLYPTMTDDKPNYEDKYENINQDLIRFSDGYSSNFEASLDNEFNEFEDLYDIDSLIVDDVKKSFSNRLEDIVLNY